MWLASDEQPVSRTQVVGHRWSAHSFEVRDFLARNSVPYRWLTSEEPEGQRLLAAAGVDATAIPLVVTPEATVSSLRASAIWRTGSASPRRPPSTSTTS